MLEGTLSDKTVCYCLEGTLSGAAVSKLRRKLKGEIAGRVILDVSHVDPMDDETLPLLILNLVAIVHRQSKAVALRGLHQHQVRMLAHLGVELADDGSVPPRFQPKRSFIVRGA